MLEKINRRSFLKTSSVAGVGLGISHLATAQRPVHGHPYFGDGIKIGETTTDSTIVWLRLTELAEPKWDGLQWLGTEDRAFDVGEFGQKQLPDGAAIADMAGSLPGIRGSVRLSWWPRNQPQAKAQTDWLAVDQNRDFTRQVTLKDLEPHQRYELKIESRSLGGEAGQTITGYFATAPGPGESGPLRFVVSACQSWKTRDKGTAGLQIYDQMLELDPSFFVHLGDIVYYDKISSGGDVDARTPALARFHWNRWYGCSDVVNFHQRIPSFFIKDDHDTVTNDSEPGMNVGTLSWITGLAIFREQVPIGHPTYRSRRWSQDLHFWMVEGRDYRSSNDMPDGLNKSIWGAEQKAWFKEEVLASDAPFKVLFSPTPIVGPDKPGPGKRDNHSNLSWKQEGEDLRDFCSKNKVIVICGDRHWQYHSRDDETGLHEFCSGAASDEHADGFSMDQRTVEHQYLAIIGGFLSAEINPGAGNTQLTIRHHRVDGSVAYEYSFSR